ncbi:hypothetical protein AAMO2058_000691600 [Amorphochlora amoebiformis]
MFLTRGVPMHALEPNFSESLAWVKSPKIIFLTKLAEILRKKTRALGTACPCRLPTTNSEVRSAPLFTLV